MIEQQTIAEQELSPVIQECCELYGEYCYPCQAKEATEQREDKH